MMTRIHFSMPKRAMRAGRSRIRLAGWAAITAALLLSPATRADGPAEYSPSESTAAAGRILAVYGDAVSRPEPPDGWRFLWNPAGPPEQVEHLAPLIPIERQAGRRRTHRYAVPDEHGAAREDLPFHMDSAIVQAFRAEDGTAHYAVAEYTMAENTEGDVWLQHGNLLAIVLDSAELRVTLNDQKVLRREVERSDRPHLFQHRLGQLQRGDVIRVALGPAENARRIAVRLRFTLEEYPAGATPEPPVNIVRPAIHDAEPPRAADGRFAAYLGRHREQSERVLEQNPELVLIGDSITARWPAELLDEHYAAFRPVNLGIGGDWIQNVHWRIRNGVLNRVDIRVAVLLIGTNNLSNRFTNEEVVHGISLLLDALRETTPKTRVLLLGILPRPEPLGTRVREVNAELAGLADNEHVFFLDVGDALLEPDGTIHPDVMPDQLHVALPGFIRWMEAMRPTLDRLLRME